MFDLGWSELLVIGVVALIVVGPKDLPVLFRQAGRFMGRMKAMAREFSQAMNDAADESGLREMSDTMRAASDPATYGVDKIRDAIKEPAAALKPFDEAHEEPDVAEKDPAQSEK